MKKSWLIALAVVFTAAVAAVALVLAGLWPPPQAAPGQPSGSPSPAGSASPAGSPSPDPSPRPPTITYSATAEDAEFSFEHPREWKVAGPGNSLKVTNAEGEEMASLSVLSIWDANAAMAARPVTSLPSTPGLVPLSRTGAFVVRNLAMDLRPFPADLREVKWPKPVQLSMSMSGPAAPPKELPPFLLYGLAEVETGKVSLGGLTTRLVLFNASRYFDTMDEVDAYAKTDEYQKIQAMIASFKG